MSKNKDRDDLCCHKNHLGWRIFWGFIFLLGAAAVILGAMNILTLGVNIGWILLCILLIAVAITALIKLNWFGVFMPIAGILTIFITQTEYIPTLSNHIGTTWIVAVLLSISFSILFRHNHRYFYHKQSPKKYSTDSQNAVNFDVSFSESTKYIDSDNLEIVNVSCSFGSAKLYFDNAKISEKGAIINADVSFGNLEIHVPSNWKVIDRANSSFGGVTETNYHKSEKSENIITLTGSVSFAGVEIIYS